MSNAVATLVARAGYQQARMTDQEPPALWSAPSRYHRLRCHCFVTRETTHRETGVGHKQNNG